MKRFYLAVAFVASFAFGANAQNVDIAGFTTIPDGTSLCSTKNFSPSENPTGDSIHGIYGLEFRGPDGMITGDKVTFRSSFSHFLTQAECDAQVPPVLLSERYAWYSIITVTDANISNNGIFFSFDSIGGIGMLLDWDIWDEYGGDSIKMYGPPHESFVDGKDYGFFVRTWGMGESADAIVNTDDSMKNNWKVVRIKWNDCATSIKDMFVPKNKVDLTVYPNPAVDQVGFKFNFEKNTNVSVYVRDLAGRIVKQKDFGRVLAGEQNFNMDIATLPSGVYTIEMSTGTISAISKFSVKK